MGGEVLCASLFIARCLSGFGRASQRAAVIALELAFWLTRFPGGVPRVINITNRNAQIAASPFSQSRWNVLAIAVFFFWRWALLL
jgi:hypothetical protein